MERSLYQSMRTQKKIMVYNGLGGTWMILQSIISPGITQSNPVQTEREHQLFNECENGRITESGNPTWSLCPKSSFIIILIERNVLIAKGRWSLINDYLSLIIC